MTENEHQQAAERLVLDAFNKAGKIVGTRLTTEARLIANTLNLPQLLADQAWCKELEVKLYIMQVQRDQCMHLLRGGHDAYYRKLAERERDQLKSRITELEAEVARCFYPMPDGEIGQPTTPKEQP